LKSSQKDYLNYTSLNSVQIQFKTFGFKLKTLNQIRKLFLQAFIFNLRFWPSLLAHHPAHPAFGPTSRPRPSPPSSHPIPPVTHSAAARPSPSSKRSPHHLLSPFTLETGARCSIARNGQSIQTPLPPVTASPPLHRLPALYKGAPTSVSPLPDEDINTSATIISSIEILGPIT
jgi:hypothetical protein